MSQVSQSGEILKLMTNPINLQTRLIDHLEAKLLNGTGTITDPNSVAMHLIEGFSCVTADFAMASQIASERRLAPRAQSESDLYLHMSDYDYVGSFATPSKATLALSIDKDYILTKGALINNSYRAVEIPIDTSFSLGNLDFSIYYPIRIQVDERSRIPLVTYDISAQHPLMSLDSNRVVFNEFKYLNYNLIVMYLTLYQFTRTTMSVTLDQDIGFSEAYQFSDKFYAVRLFTESRGKTIELGQSLVQDNYDATRPTARIQVMQDTQKFLINIPQIYFDLGYMGPKLEIELLTTKGHMTANVGSIPSEQVTANFRLEKKPNNPLTDPMRFNPTLFANVTSPKTIEGSDGYTYEEKRDRVIHGSFRTKAQITPIDLQNYYADYGIKVERYEDDLTNLMYFVYKSFLDSENQIVGSANTYLELLPDTPDRTSTIIANVDGSITVLPTTWFRYKDSENSCIPLTDSEVTFMSEMDKKTLALEFNENSYVRPPFHLRLITNPTYAYVTPYNLMQPKVDKVTVTDENPNALAQMLMVGESIVHERDGDGGYVLRLIIKKDLMDEIPEESTHVWIYTQSTDGISIGLEAIKSGSIDGHDIYEAQLGTSYWLNTNHELEMTTLKRHGSSLKYKVDLEQIYNIVYMCDASYFPGTGTAAHLFAGVPTEIFKDQVVLLRQSMVIHLGHSLDDVIFNHVNITWDKQQYRRHQVDLPYTYGKTLYKSDSKGNPIIKIVNGAPTMEVEHHKGDPIIGENGEPEYLNRKGDLWLDSDGKPVMVNGRPSKWLIQTPVFDGRIYLSEHPTQRTFVKELMTMFETYFEIIRNARGYVTERTMVYFKPIRTIGSAVYKTGDGIKLTLPLDMKLAFKLHTDPVVNLDSEIRNSIRDVAINTIEPLLQEEIISQTAMARAIKDKVMYVESVDSLGIDGYTDLQTLQMVEGEGKPSIRRKLIVSDDNQLIFDEDIQLTFVDYR